MLETCDLDGCEARRVAPLAQLFLERPALVDFQLSVIGDAEVLLRAQQVRDKRIAGLAIPICVEVDAHSIVRRQPAVSRYDRTVWAWRQSGRSPPWPTGGPL